MGPLRVYDEGVLPFLMLILAFLAQHHRLLAAAQRFFSYHRGLILLCVFRMLCHTTQSSHRATQAVVASLRWQIFTKDLNPRQRGSCAVTAAAFISCTRRRLCTTTFIRSRINIFFSRSRNIAELISLLIDLRGSGSGTAPDTRARRKIIKSVSRRRRSARRVALRTFALRWRVSLT